MQASAQLVCEDSLLASFFCLKTGNIILCFKHTPSLDAISKSSCSGKKVQLAPYRQPQRQRNEGKEFWADTQLRALEKSACGRSPRPTTAGRPMLVLLKDHGEQKPFTKGEPLLLRLFNPTNCFCFNVPASSSSSAHTKWPPPLWRNGPRRGFGGKAREREEDASGKERRGRTSEEQGRGRTSED